MNKHFRDYPRMKDIDAYGVDMLGYKGQVVENQQSYTMARYANHKVGKANAAKVVDWANTRREYNAIKEANDYKVREFNDRLAFYDKVAAYNHTHPDNPIPMPKKPYPPKLDPLPELKKAPRLASIHTLRWYEKGKAPIENPA